MNKKIIISLVTLILLIPLAPHLLSQSTSTTNKTADINDSDKSFTFKKDELGGKGVLFFQIREPSKTVFQKNYVFNFQEALTLKMPPVVHVKTDIFNNFEVFLTIKKASYELDAAKKKIVCSYRPLDQFRFHFQQCSLITGDSNSEQIANKNIFESGKKREIVVGDQDSLVISIIQTSKKEDAKTPKESRANSLVEIEAILDFVL